MNVAPPTTPQEVRDLMRTDLSLATDAHLVAMILAKGCHVRRGARAAQQTGCVELGEVVLEVMGGDWPRLVEHVAAETVDLYAFSFSLPMGARLMASVEVSLRARRGFRGCAGRAIRGGAAKALLKNIQERRGKPTVAELVAVILGNAEPKEQQAAKLLEILDDRRRLIDMTFADFESFRIRSRMHLRLIGTDVEIDLDSACRLLAAIELARRYRLERGPKLPALAPGTFGLKSPLLAELLDPESEAPAALRAATLDALRSHPEMASDFAKLDRLAKDAGTEDLPQAVRLGLMFELLRQDTEGRRPAEILGESAPFDALLALAETRIERAPSPPKRMMEIKQRLARSARQLPGKPIDRFAEALAELELPPAIADEAFEEARRRYLEITGSRQVAVA